MMKIAITGSIASGKSLVVKLLKEQFANCATFIDCDLINKELLNEVEYVKIIGDTFGVVENGVINKRALSNIIFNSEEQRLKLNAIAHPRIKERLVDRIAKSNTKYIFIEIPLLLECGFADIFDEIWVVVADKNVQIQRVQARDNLSYESACKKVDSQHSNSELVAIATNIIPNNGTIADLYNTLEELVCRYGR